MSVTLQQTEQAMSELVQAGIPNGKVAFWIAALSAINPVERNGVQGQIMHAYANRPLPLNREELWLELGGTLFHSHINTLYCIQELWNAGLIHFNCGSTFDLQCQWRKSMVSLIKGMGMKTISFALHIYDYKRCLLLTVDRHHLARLQYRCKTPSVKQYLQAEQDLYVLCNKLAYDEGQGYAPLVYAACLWERWRQEKGLGKQGEYTSHKGLSCYC
jgi:hypothetical protein